MYELWKFRSNPFSFQSIVVALLFMRECEIKTMKTKEKKKSSNSLGKSFSIFARRGKNDELLLKSNLFTSSRTNKSFLRNPLSWHCILSVEYFYEQLAYIFELLDKSLLINVNFLEKIIKTLENPMNFLFKFKTTNFIFELKNYIFDMYVITICGIFLNIPLFKYFHIFHFAVNTR